MRDRAGCSAAPGFRSERSSLLRLATCPGGQPVERVQRLDVRPLAVSVNGAERWKRDPRRPASRPCCCCGVQTMSPSAQSGLALRHVGLQLTPAAWCRSHVMSGSRHSPAVYWRLIERGPSGGPRSLVAATHRDRPRRCTTPAGPPRPRGTDGWQAPRGDRLEHFGPWSTNWSAYDQQFGISRRVVDNPSRQVGPSAARKQGDRRVRHRVWRPRCWATKLVHTGHRRCRRESAPANTSAGSSCQQGQWKGRTQVPGQGSCARQQETCRSASGLHRRPGTSRKYRSNERFSRITTTTCWIRDGWDPVVVATRPDFGK